MDRERKDRESAPDERDVLDAETTPGREADDMNRAPEKTGRTSSPGFGSATSGGGEFERGPKKN